MTPQEEFIEMMDYSGITRWHDAGYKGQGIKVFNCESMNSKHGQGTGTILKRCAPEAEFYCGDLGIEARGDELLSARTNGMDLFEYIKSNGIDIMTASLADGINKGWVEYCERLQAETDVVIFNAAGNEYANTTETLNHCFPSSVANLVGALSWDDGKPKRINYSSVGEELDFMAFAGLIGGTSAASPFLAGMAACIFSKYGKMSPSATKDYLKSISKDMGAAGDDIYYGEGMPILGDPKTTIKLQIGSNKMSVDGKDVTLDQPAEIDTDTNRTLIPVRAVVEALGATVTWDDATDTITIVR